MSYIKPHRKYLEVSLPHIEIQSTYFQSCLLTVYSCQKHKLYEYSFYYTHYMSIVKMLCTEWEYAHIVHCI
jgi:hypothetical protein